MQCTARFLMPQSVVDFLKIFLSVKLICCRCVVLFAGCDVSLPQVVDIRDRQSRQCTKSESIPDSFRSFIGYWAFPQYNQFRLLAAS